MKKNSSQTGHSLAVAPASGIPAKTSKGEKQFRFHFSVQLIFLFVSMCGFAQNEWTWIKGADHNLQKGIYGAKNVPHPNNTPGVRFNAQSWTDLSGNLWLYGGNGMDSTGMAGDLSDLWKFDVALKQWMWVSGSALSEQVTNNEGKITYGVLGVASPSNNPGARAGSANWIDNAGNLWLFGGAASDTVGGGNGQMTRNDLWKYDITSGNWTWMKGSKLNFTPGTYGTQGVAAPGNTPGARGQMICWTDLNGNFWMYGGEGTATNTINGWLSDLWKYDPVTNQWTWVKGAAALNQLSNFGTMGVSAASNTPGSRTECNSWIDNSGNLWLYGGAGYDQSAVNGTLSDLWKYNIATNQWTWMKGNTARNQLPVYGTMNVAAATNKPGAMAMGASWKDANGDLWLGNGSAVNNFGSGFDVNFMWKYNIATNQWTWTKGPNQVADQGGIYGTQGVPAIPNIPGGRTYSESWSVNGEFWFFGGFGHGSNVSVGGSLNDLWRFIPCITSTVIPTNTTPAANYTVCAGSSATLSASSAGAIGWYSSAGAALGTGSVYATPGLTTTTTFLFGDNVSCLLSSLTITVVPAPTLSITAGTYTVCAGKSTTLTAVSNAAYYSWDTGAATQTISISPSVPSVYNVTVTAFPSGCTTTGSRTIAVAASPTVSAASTHPLLCPGQSATLTASGANSYTWTPGTTAASITVSPSATTLYTLTGRNTANCTNSITLVQAVNPPITAASSSTRTCAGQTATLTASGASTYTWSSGSLASTATVAPVSTTVYTVTGSDANCTGTTTVVQQVDPLPGVVAFSTHTLLCAGDQATLTVAGAATYTWSNGATGNSTTVSPGSATVYSVTGTELNNCSNTETVSISVAALPMVSVTSASAAVCAGQAVTLSASGASTYTWNTGASGTSLTVSPAATQGYTVTGEDANHCFGSAVLTQSVNPLPQISATTSQTLLCQGQSAALTASGASTYTWSTGTVASSITVAPTLPTSYTVTGQDANHCQNTAMLTQSVSLCTGLDENNAEHSYIALFPNPNQGVLQVTVERDLRNGKLILVDQLGRTVYAEALYTGINTVHLNDLAKGIYHYTIVDATGIVKNGKVIVE